MGSPRKTLCNLSAPTQPSVNTQRVPSSSTPPSLPASLPSLLSYRGGRCRNRRESAYYCERKITELLRGTTFGPSLSTTSTDV